MQLKANTKYRRRDGVVVGPLTYYEDHSYPWLDERHDISYLGTGREFADDVSDGDLIAEVSDNPWKRMNEGPFTDSVEGLHRDGSVATGPAHQFRWNEFVAWRPVATPKPEPLTTEQRLARLEAHCGF